MEHADAVLARTPRARTVVARVKALLRSERSLREVSAERIAKRLGMSVRTLSRKLDAESTSYREQIDEAREQAASHALAQTARPIVEIADDLGFASTQSFHRAFRRWTGTTAAAFRERGQRRASKQRKKHG